MAETTKKTTRKPKQVDAVAVPVSFCRGERVELTVDGAAVAAAFRDMTGRELPRGCRVKLLPQSSGDVLIELVFRTAVKAGEFANGKAGEASGGT